LFLPDGTVDDDRTTQASKVDEGAERVDLLLRAVPPWDHTVGLLLYSRSRDHTRDGKPSRRAFSTEPDKTGFILRDDERVPHSDRGITE